MQFVLHSANMEIEWQSEKDREIVMQLAQKSRVTARRMNAIAAASNFNDIAHPANGRAHFLTQEYEGHFAIDLESKTRPARLICKPAGEYRMIGMRYIKETITSLKVVKIERNYHKK